MSFQQEQAKDMKPDLTEIMPLMAETVRECFECMFMIKPAIKAPWSIEPRLHGMFDHVFSMGNSNQNYQAMLTVGVPDNTLVNVISDDPDTAIDAMSEFVNVCCGMIMDIELFTKKFGFLLQSVPLYAQENTLFPKIDCIDGRVYFEGNDWVNFGYAIRPVSF